MTTLQDVLLSSVEMDDSYMVRAQLDDMAVKEYEWVWQTWQNNGKEKYPFVDGSGNPDYIVLTWDHDIYWVASGWHRLTAARNIGLEIIPSCDVREGGREASMDLGARYNHKHGVKRTIQDRKKSIRILFQLHPDWSVTHMAKEVDVSQQLASKIWHETGVAGDQGFTDNRGILDHLTSSEERRERRENRKAPEPREQVEGDPLHLTPSEKLAERFKADELPAPQFEDLSAVPGRPLPQDVVEKLRVIDEAIDRAFAGFVHAVDNRAHALRPHRPTDVRMFSEDVRTHLREAKQTIETWRGRL